MAEGEGNSVSDRIVAAGLALLEEEGLRALTQPRIAKRSGVRQSHVTYYFPRIDNLLLAVFEASHRQAQQAPTSVPRDALDTMRDVLFDRGRMQFFLRIIADVSESDELLPIVAAHGRSLGTAVAPVFGRSPDDPDILAFVDLMRGRAMRHLLHPDQPVPDRSEMIAVAARLSLKPVWSDGSNDEAATHQKDFQ